MEELLVADAYRGQGYGTKLLGGFIQKLDATYFTCYIDSDNISSTKTALRSGQEIFSQECSFFIYLSLHKTILRSIK